jgi:hypothetical protein
MSQTHNLFLVEHSSHVDDLLRRNVRNQGEWIALGTGAMYALKKEGIPYKIPEDFCNNEEMGKLCFSYHDKLEKFCNCMDEIFYDKYPELRVWGIHPFLFHVFDLTKLVDAMVSRIFQLRTILNAYPNYKLWVHRASFYPWGEYDISFSNKETLWGHILSLLGWNRDIEFLEEPKAAILYSLPKRLLLKLKKIQGCLLQIVKEFINKTFILNNCVTNLRLIDTKRLLSLVKRKSRDILLLHGGFYNWRWVVPLLWDKQWGVIFTNDEMFKGDSIRGGQAACHYLDDFVRGNPDVSYLFETCGISFYSLLRERLAWILENSFPQCKNIIARCEEVIRRYNVKAVLTSNTPAFTGHALAQACRHFHLQVIRWQHGFMVAQNGRINQLNEYNDVMTSDVVFTFGQAVTKAHELYIHKFPAKVISIGSSSLDKIREIRKKGKEISKRTILYVTTSYYRNRWYCGFSPPFSDRYLLKDQMMIMDSLKQIVNNYEAKVTVKLPRASFSVLPLANEFSLIFRVVVVSPNFIQLMYENNIIIIDAPTTTVLEAVATKKPVFVLMNHIRYPDIARILLQKRAVCADSVEELMSQLQCYIEQGIYAADVDNDEYLREYGNYLNDGKSAQRALNKVLEIVEI